MTGWKNKYKFMTNMKKPAIILSIIFLVASFFRLWRLDFADVITDEGLIGFRSIGLVDFLGQYQTTPWLWSPEIEGWMHLSFHDHPPLVFWLQHLFFKVLGVNLWSLRLPFALAGIISIWLVYLIGKELKDRNTGLISALFLSVISYHVWISRIGLQESLLIVFILASLYFFLKNLKVDLTKLGKVGKLPPFLLFGLFFGLALLVKYTAVIFLIPIFFYLLVYRRDLLASHQFWLSLVFSLILFSPVIIYNLQLYQNFNHFDFQFSYLLSQQVTEWQLRPGREAWSSLITRVRGIPQNFKAGYSWLMIVLFFLSLFRLNSQTKRVASATKQKIVWLIVVLFSLLLLYLLVGPSVWFMSLTAPFISLLIGLAVTRFLQEEKQLRLWFKLGVVSLIIAFEIFYTTNTFYTLQPWGKAGLTFAQLRLESNIWGYNELEEYIRQELQGKYPLRTFPTKFNFLESIKKESLAKAKTQGLKGVSYLLVVDERINDIAGFWIFMRRVVYKGWPILTTNEYANLLSSDPQYFVKQGVERVYLIAATGNTLLQKQPSQVEFLKPKFGPPVKEIFDKQGRKVFVVYIKYL